MDLALVLCRALQFTAAIALFGVSAFQAMAVPNGLAQVIAPPLRRLAAMAIILIAVTAIVWLLLETVEVTGDWLSAMSPATLTALLFETEFGRVWQCRLAFVAILLAILVMRRHDNWRITAFWSALVLASLGFVGHGAMYTGGLGWLNRSSRALHLLAAGFWLGSLVPLLVCLPMLRHPGFAVDAAVALRRFSALGPIAVATVLLTGMANTWLAIEVWPINFQSPYQELLLAKIGLIAAMIGLALVNRFMLTTRLVTAPETWRKLRTNTVAEVILGLAAIVLVSVMGTLAPS